MSVSRSSCARVPNLGYSRKQWRTAIVGGDVALGPADPADFAQAAAHIRPDDLRPHVLVSADPTRHVTWLHEYAELGVDEIYLLHHVGQDQRQFLDVFGAEVLPQLDEARPAAHHAGTSVISRG